MKRYIAIAALLLAGCASQAQTPSQIVGMTTEPTDAVIRADNKAAADAAAMKLSASAPEWLDAYRSLWVIFRESDMFSLYDLTGDGIPEMIVSTGDSPEAGAQIFTFRDGKAHMLYAEKDGIKQDTFGSCGRLAFAPDGGYIISSRKNGRCVDTDIYTADPGSDRLIHVLSCHDGRYDDGICRAEHDGKCDKGDKNILNNALYDYRDLWCLLLGREYAFSGDSGYRTFDDIEKDIAGGIYRHCTDDIILCSDDIPHGGTVTNVTCDLYDFMELRAYGRNYTMCESCLVGQAITYIPEDRDSYIPGEYTYSFTPYYEDMTAKKAFIKEKDGKLYLCMASVAGDMHYEAVYSLEEGREVYTYKGRGVSDTFMEYAANNGLEINKSSDLFWFSEADRITEKAYKGGTAEDPAVYMAAYREKICSDKDFIPDMFSLYDITGDGIPEMILSAGDWKYLSANGGMDKENVRILSFDGTDTKLMTVQLPDGSETHDMGSLGVIRYSPYQNIIITPYADTDSNEITINVYRAEGGRLSCVMTTAYTEGTYTDDGRTGDIYSVNGKTCTKKEYEAAFEPYMTPDLMSCGRKHSMNADMLREKYGDAYDDHRQYTYEDTLCFDDVENKLIGGWLPAYMRVRLTECKPEYTYYKFTADGREFEFSGERHSLWDVTEGSGTGLGCDKAAFVCARGDRIYFCAAGEYHDENITMETICSLDDEEYIDPVKHGRDEPLSDGFRDYMCKELLLTFTDMHPEWTDTRPYNPILSRILE